MARKVGKPKALPKTKGGNEWTAMPQKTVQEDRQDQKWANGEPKWLYNDAQLSIGTDGYRMHIVQAPDYDAALTPDWVKEKYFSILLRNADDIFSIPTEAMLRGAKLMARPSAISDDRCCHIRVDQFKRVSLHWKGTEPYNEFELTTNLWDSRDWVMQSHIEPIIEHRFCVDRGFLIDAFLGFDPAQAVRMETLGPSTRIMFTQSTEAGQRFAVLMPMQIRN